MEAPFHSTTKANIVVKSVIHDKGALALRSKVGEADVLGQMSGSGVTFLFPDHTTALTGTFCKSEMILGQVSFIQVQDHQ